MISQWRNLTTGKRFFFLFVSLCDLREGFMYFENDIKKDEEKEKKDGKTFNCFLCIKKNWEIKI